MQAWDKKYTFADLVALRRDPPPDCKIDWTRQEDFLTESEFERVMKMTREQWDKLPDWKKKQRRERSGVF